MACRDAYKTKTMMDETDVVQASVTEPVVAQNVERLLFGVDSKNQANDLLQFRRNIHGRQQRPRTPAPFTQDLWRLEDQERH